MIKNGREKTMEKHLIFTGADGSDCSAIIKTALGDKLACAGGYVTEAAYAPDGRVSGYALLPAAGAAGVAGYEAKEFLRCGEPRWTHDSEVFRSEGARLLQEAQYYPFAVADAFGGFDLIIPQFREALLDALNADTPLIGVLVGEDAGEELRRRLGLGEKYTAYRRALRAALENDAQTRLAEVRAAGDPAAARLAAQWAAEYAVG